MNTFPCAEGNGRNAVSVPMFPIMLVMMAAVVARRRGAAAGLIDRTVI
jgi:hypothetical protein